MARAAPVPEERQSLYEHDFGLWLERQAGLLREGRLSELDVANLLEEIEAMGRKDKKAIQSDLVVVMAHLLTYQFQPDQRSGRLAWLHCRASPAAPLRSGGEPEPPGARRCSLCPGLCRRPRTGERRDRPAARGLPRGTAPTPWSRRSTRSSCPTEAPGIAAAKGQPRRQGLAMAKGHPPRRRRGHQPGAGGRRGDRPDQADFGGVAGSHPRRGGPGHRAQRRSLSSDTRRR